MSVYSFVIASAIFVTVHFMGTPALAFDSQGWCPPSVELVARGRHKSPTRASSPSDWMHAAEALMDADAPTQSRANCQTLLSKNLTESMLSPAGLFQQFGRPEYVDAEKMNAHILRMFSRYKNWQKAAQDSTSSSNSTAQQKANFYKNALVGAHNYWSGQYGELAAWNHLKGQIKGYSGYASILGLSLIHI